MSMVCKRFLRDGLSLGQRMEVNTRAQFLSSIFWASSTSGLAKVLNLISLLVLARLLDPHSFGLVAIALLIIGGFDMLANLGLGSALIQKKDPTDEDANAIFILSPIASVFLYAAAFIFSDSAGRFFNSGEIPLIIKILSLMLIIQSLASVQSALLEKRLAYKKRFIPDSISNLSYLLVAVSMALLGFGVWSLVIGSLVRCAVNTLLLWWVLPWRPSLTFDLASAKGLLNYGKHIVLLGVISFLFRNIDNAVIAKYLTPTYLGYYTLAYTLANILPQIAKMTIGRIVFPLYSQLRQDMDAFKNAFLPINQVNMIFSVGFTILLVASIPAIVAVFLGEKWGTIRPLVQILAFLGLQRAIASVGTPALNAFGVPQRQRGPMILNFLLFVALVIPVAIKFGVLGVAYLATIGAIPGFLWAMVRTFRLVGIKEELKRFFHPFFLGCTCLAIGLSLSAYLSDVLLIRSILSTIFVLLTFSSSIFILQRDLIKRAYQMRRDLREALR